MEYPIEVIVELKPDILDPQGKTIQKALVQMGHESVKSARVGKSIKLMVEADSELWDRLYFRDYLCRFPEEAKRYEELKISATEKFANDRVKYTEAKSEFIQALTGKAKVFYKF